MRPRFDGPFVLPVRDIVAKPGEMREHSFTAPTPAPWGEGIVSVPEGTDVHLDVRLESVHEGILVSVEADTRYVGICGRCLRDIEQGVEVEFQELFEYDESETSDFEVQDDHVDLETPVRDAIVLSLPFQPVCQPDCPGLDPETGERLTSTAGRTQDVPIDPRWAALKDLTESNGPADAGSPTEES